MSILKVANVHFDSTGTNRIDYVGGDNIVRVTSSAMKLPVGDTAGRPTPEIGLIRFNSELGTFEGRNASAWGSIGGSVDLSQPFSQANTARDHANAAFGKANSALANTSGAVFNGNLPVLGNVLVDRTDSTVGFGVKLDINGSINTASVIAPNLIFDSIGATFIRANGANTLTITTAGTEDLRIDSSGNVLIGRIDSTVGQSTRLDVNGAVNASAVLINGVAVVGGSGVALSDQSTATAIRYLTMTQLTTGSSATLNVASTKLTFNIATGTLSSVVFNSTSDINKKTNIWPITEPMQIVDKLNGYKFNWKDNGMPSVGVIAQEVEQILPELIGDDKSVNYNGLIAVLIEAVKELKREIEELKSNK